MISGDLSQAQGLQEAVAGEIAFYVGAGDARRGTTSGVQVHYHRPVGPEHLGVAVNLDPPCV